MARSNKTSGPWCWTEKAALDAIAERFGENCQQATARSVYLVLCQIASDEQMERFQARIGVIALKAGVSPRTTQTILSILEKTGLVKIERQVHDGAKIASIYTLEGLGNKNTTPEIKTRVRKLKQESCNGQQRTSVADILNNIEESKKESSEQSHGGVEQLLISVPDSKQLALEIFELYPAVGRQSKPKGLEAILKAMRSHPSDSLRRQTEAYAKAVAGLDIKIPHITTWFNQERFLADPSTWTAYANNHQRSKPFIPGASQL